MLAIFKAAFSAVFPVGLIADSFLALYKELELCDYIFITAALLAVVVLMLRRDSIFYANGIIVINLGAVIAQFGRQSDENIPLLYNTIKLRKSNEQNVNFTEKHLTKRRKSAVSLPVAMKPIEIGVYFSLFQGGFQYELCREITEEAIRCH